MLKWRAKRYKHAEEDPGSGIAKLEQKIEKLEQTVQALYNRKSVVVRQLHIDRPVIENVTFRLDSLDIEELSGALNLGNNFDVDVDPEWLLRRFAGKAKKEQPAPAAKEQTDKNAKQDVKRHVSSQSEQDPESAIRKTSTGFSYQRKAPDPRP
jgi:hypothetical protein